MDKINEHSETLWQDLCDIARKRDWDERLSGIKGAYIRPNGLEHDSSFGCFDIIAYSRDPDTHEVVNYVLCGGATDDISFEGASLPHGLHVSVRCNSHLESEAVLYHRGPQLYLVC